MVFFKYFLFFVSSYYWSDIFIFYFVIFCFCFQSLLLVSFVYFLFCYFLFYFVVATNGQILFFSPYYWSDMFTVLVNMSTSMQICEDWNINDMTIQTMHHENVTSCPCSLDVALLDLTRFHIDPLCVETAVNVYDCYQQPFAKLCFKQNLPSWVFKSYTRKQIPHKIYMCNNKFYLHVWVGIWRINGNHLHDYIIFLRRNVWAHKSSLMPSLLITCLFQTRKVSHQWNWSDSVVYQTKHTEIIWLLKLTSYDCHW